MYKVISHKAHASCNCEYCGRKINAKDNVLSTEDREVTFCSLECVSKSIELCKMMTGEDLGEIVIKGAQNKPCKVTVRSKFPQLGNCPDEVYHFATLAEGRAKFAHEKNVIISIFGAHLLFACQVMEYSTFFGVSRLYASEFVNGKPVRNTQSVSLDILGE